MCNLKGLDFLKTAYFAFKWYCSKFLCSSYDSITYFNKLSFKFQAAIFKYIASFSAESESIQLLPIDFIRIFAHSQ